MQRKRFVELFNFVFEICTVNKVSATDQATMEPLRWTLWIVPIFLFVATTNYMLNCPRGLNDNCKCLTYFVTSVEAEIVPSFDYEWFMVGLGTL
jgi:hypothetical protein